jgi:hypothetical protein
VAAYSVVVSCLDSASVAAKAVVVVVADSVDLHSVAVVDPVAAATSVAAEVVANGADSDSVPYPAVASVAPDFLAHSAALHSTPDPSVAVRADAVVAAAAAVKPGIVGPSVDYYESFDDTSFAAKNAAAVAFGVDPSVVARAAHFVYAVVLFHLDPFLDFVVVAVADASMFARWAASFPLQPWQPLDSGEAPTRFDRIVAERWNSVALAMGAMVAFSEFQETVEVGQ